MDEELLQQLAQKYINRDKWWEIISRFIEVLRMNIFVIDAKDRLLLPPEEARFGGRFLVDESFKTNIHRSGGYINKFLKHGLFLEEKNQFKLFSYAIPIKLNDNQILAYMVIGPVILNKRLSSSDYEQLAIQYGIEESKLVDEISGLRVVSNLMMNSILELLSEIIREALAKSVKEDRYGGASGYPAQDVESVVNEVVDTVNFNELLGTLLDSALNMTNSECGSIMILDEQRGELSIRVSRGLDAHIVKNAKQKLGEGLSGLVAQENTEYVLNEESAAQNNRIGHLLKRPEVKHAIIIPLLAKGKVFGVMNLHTKSKHNRIEEKLDGLKHLTNLMSSVL